MKRIIDVDENLICEGFVRNFTEEEKDVLINAIRYSIPYEEKPTVNCKSCDGYEAGYSAGLKDAERPRRRDFERPQGEWIKWNFKTFGAMGDCEYKCSNCEKVYGGEYNFCPNCGAKMRGGAE